MWEPLIKRYIVTSQDSNRLRYRWENLTSCISGNARKDVDTAAVSLHTWQVQQTHVQRRGRRRLRRNCRPIIIPLQPSGHYMYHQCNIHKSYVLPTHYLCVLCGSEHKQRLFPYTELTDQFLDAFAKLQIAAIIFVMSVRPSAWKYSAPTGRIFMKFYISVFVENPSRKPQFHCNLTRITVLYIKANVNVWWYLADSSEREILQTNVVEKIKTHILCSITFFQKSCRLCDNVEKYCRAGQATDDNIRRMRIACWLPKATNTHSEYVILIALPLQQW